MTKAEQAMEQIIDKYSYNPETGIIRGQYGRKITGKIRGYIVFYFTVDNKKHRISGHRLAYRKMTGSWLSSNDQIDHIDRNRANNTWSNLRVVNQNLNNINSAPRGQSGIRGVSYHKNDKCWMARMHINKKEYVLYRGESKDKAIFARKKAEQMVFEDKNIEEICNELGAKVTQSRKNQSTGIRGVSLVGGSYRVIFGIHGKKYNLYCGKDKQEAIARRQIAEQVRADGGGIDEIMDAINS